MDMSDNELTKINYLGVWRNKETYFWTRDEIGPLSIEWESKKLIRRKFQLEDISFEWKELGPPIHQRLLYEFEDNKVNVVVIHQNGINPNDFLDFIGRLEDLPKTTEVILVFAKGTEDYWMDNVNRESDELIRRVSDMGNVKVIWDIALKEYPNFYFSPKVHIQSYYDNNVFDGDIFFYGRDLFKHSPKPHRIGLHINKVTDRVRESLANRFYDNTNPVLNCTINKGTLWNKQQNKGAVLNYTSPHFDTKMYHANNGLRENWYLLQFIEQTVKSEMEVIYETFTITSHYTFLIKWNEKTIKQLFLGKPFIHTDPMAHRLLRLNGFTPYRSLFTDELWNIYESWDISKPIDYTDNSFLSPLIRNIEWLRDMSNEEWLIRIGEANEVAIRNREYSHRLIFDTHLRDFI